MKKIPLTLLAFCSLNAVSSATLVSVFEYEFDSSYDASTTTVTDQSPAGNHAVATGEAGSNIALSSDIPTGGTKGSHSLDFSTTYGVVATNAKNLLNNAAVVANGGFTFSADFKGFSDNPRKIIDYAGTEYIAARNDGGTARIGIGISNTVPLVLTAAEGVDELGWNSITYSFSVTDGSNTSAVVGNIRVELNGTITTLNNQTLTDFGDSLNRSISVGRHPEISTDHYRGKIYAPSAYLGVATVPEPSTNLLGLLGIALVLRRRR